jgi:hypothetical protein
MASLTMIEEKGNESQRFEAVELKVSRWTKTGDRLEAEMRALRLGSVTKKLGEPAPSFSADLDDLRSGFQRDITAASDVLRAEISLLKSACLASISGVFSAFQRSSTIFSKGFPFRFNHGK